MSADAFSHSKRTADLRVALDVITNEFKKKKEKLMLTCEGVKQQTGEMKMEC